MKRKNGGGEFIHRRRKGVGVGKENFFLALRARCARFARSKKKNGCGQAVQTYNLLLCALLARVSWIVGLNEYTGLEFRERGGHLF